MAYNRTIYSKGTATYKDLDMSFAKNPATDDLRVKSDVEAIKQSVKNLVFLNYGDLPFRPLYGGNVRSKLFEPATALTASDIETSIRKVLRDEPRVEVVAVRVTDDNFDVNSMAVTVVVNILNIESQIEVPIILKRSR